MSIEKTTMRFLFGDRELLLVADDLLSAPVEVIVNPTDCALRHQEGLARQIRQAAGSRFQEESDQLIREYGQIESGMAVYTCAGELPFKAIVHAVGPCKGEGDEQRKLEQAISRSLQLCEMNEWRSIGFPPIGIGNLELPIDLCAQAFFRAITRFWDARHDCVVEKVMVLLHQDQFRPFFDSFREQGFATEPDKEHPSQTGSEESVGHIEFSEADIADLDEMDINKWFK